MLASTLLASMMITQVGVPQNGPAALPAANFLSLEAIHNFTFAVDRTRETTIPVITTTSADDFRLELKVGANFVPYLYDGSFGGGVALRNGTYRMVALSPSTATTNRFWNGYLAPKAASGAAWQDHYLSADRLWHRFVPADGETFAVAANTVSLLYVRGTLLRKDGTVFKTFFKQSSFSESGYLGLPGQLLPAGDYKISHANSGNRANYGLVIGYILRR